MFLWLGNRLARKVCIFRPCNNTTESAISAVSKFFWETSLLGVDAIAATGAVSIGSAVILERFGRKDPGSGDINGAIIMGLGSSSFMFLSVLITPFVVARIFLAFKRKTLTIIHY